MQPVQFADPADIRRRSPAGIIASTQASHQTSARLIAEKRLGPSRLAGAYAGHSVLLFFFQAEVGIRFHCVTGVQTCALPISRKCSATGGVVISVRYSTSSRFSLRQVK